MAAAREVKPRILIAGYGDLGSKVGELLSTQGATVTGLCRTPRLSAKDIHLLACNVCQPSTLHPLSDLAPDILLYSVAADAQTDANYQSQYVDGLRNVLDALKPAPPKHVFFVSSTRVYGQNSETLLDEGTPAVPSDFGGERLQQAEQLALENGVPATVLRLSGIYGPGRLRMLRLAQQSPDTWPANSWTNRIHRDDAAGFIVHLINKAILGDQLSSHYIVTDDVPVAMHEVLNWLAQQMGLPHRSTILEMQGGKRLSNRRLKQTGFCFRYPSYREGYATLMGADGRK